MQHHLCGPVRGAVLRVFCVGHGRQSYCQVGTHDTGDMA